MIGVYTLSELDGTPLGLKCLEELEGLWGFFASGSGPWTLGKRDSKTISDWSLQFSDPEPLRGSREPAQHRLGVVIPLTPKGFALFRVALFGVCGCGLVWVEVVQGLGFAGYSAAQNPQLPFKIALNTKPFCHSLATFAIPNPAPQMPWIRYRCLAGPLQHRGWWPLPSLAMRDEQTSPSGFRSDGLMSCPAAKITSGEKLMFPAAPNPKKSKEIQTNQTN